MDLNGDDAGGIDGRVGLGVVHCLHAIEPDLNARSFGSDAVVVPFSDRFTRLFQHFLRGSLDDFAAADGVVERSVVTCAEVSLKTGDLMRRWRNTFRAELHAAIHEALGAFQLPFQREFEVAELLFRREIVVVELLLLE